MMGMAVLYCRRWLAARRSALITSPGIFCRERACPERVPSLQARLRKGGYSLAAGDSARWNFSSLFSVLLGHSRNFHFAQTLPQRWFYR